MLGFRPIRSESASRSSTPQRRQSSSPLPVIYEHGSASSPSRSSDGSPSRHSSSSSSSSLDESNIVWPPLHSPSWPPRDDEPLIRRWNEYGAMSSRDFDAFVSRSDSEATEVHSNCVGDVHHRFNCSVEHRYDDDGRDFHSLLDDSFHRRHRVSPSVMRLWHLLSILVVVSFCSSLVLVPSVLQQSSTGQWGGEEHGQYKEKHHGDKEHFRRRPDGSPDREWHYPNPWKYLFGLGNNDKNPDDRTNQTDVFNGNTDAVIPEDSSGYQNEAASTLDSDISINYHQDQYNEMAAALANQTFAALASLMLPPYLQTTIDLCQSTIIPQSNSGSNSKNDKQQLLSKSSHKKKHVNNAKIDLNSFSTTSIPPSSVFGLRKQLLKTRDLLDVFSPVYPSSTTKYHRGDLSFETRDNLAYAKHDLDLIVEKDGRLRFRHDVDKVGRGEKGTSSRSKENHHDKHHHEHGYKLSNHAKHQDLWKTLRTYLDEGYTIIGDFQDLDHAHILYTQEQLALSQTRVWEWYVDFMTYIQKEYLVVMGYLSHPCPEEESHTDTNGDDDEKGRHERSSGKSKSGKRSKRMKRHLSKADKISSCQYGHSHSSHLFWGGAPDNELPQGDTTMARVALGRLGKEQLARAQGYLNQLWGHDHVIPTFASSEKATKQPKAGKARESDLESQQDEESLMVHEVYHNLRKELRSFLDEVDLFGTLLLRDTMVRPEVIVLGLANQESDGQEEADATLASVNPTIVNTTTPEGDIDFTPPAEYPSANINVAQTNDIGPQFSPPIDPNPPSTESDEEVDTTPLVEIPIHEQVIGSQTSPSVDPNPTSSSNPASEANTMSARQKTFDALTSLRQTRKLLGDLNDDYTAYQKYVEWDTNHEEQIQLIYRIETEWNNFRWWASQIGLNEQIQYLISNMADDESLQTIDVGMVAEQPTQEETLSTVDNSLESQTPDAAIGSDDPGILDMFLQRRKSNPTSHIVIGNDAGDADSIISAISLAFVESTYGNTKLQSTPIVSISKGNFEQERPELNLLFKLAGIEDVANKLIFVDDLVEVLSTTPTTLDFTLVDHNTINTALYQYSEKQNVVEIVDHHEDKGQFRDTCSGPNRTIAFSNCAASVASTCTLVAERLKSLTNSDDHYPESLATLLMGVILIDSVGFDNSLGKVTQRDKDAVEDLIAGTNWKPTESKSYLALNNEGDVTVYIDVLFCTLQKAKYEPSFWSSLPVDRALFYDYKDFHVTIQSQQRSFGISTVLTSGSEFIKKNDFALTTEQFMLTNDIPMLGIMFAFYDNSNDKLLRQLAICADDTIEIDALVSILLSSQAYHNVNLELEEVTSESFRPNKLQLYLFDQNNVQPSRKQIGPLFEIVYESLLS